ncbi:MAG: exopolysaccharide biosynthesis protein [Acidobacteria bacterium]|nr:exopolysaccharide biosynthesis protein [Acidobacteriota bacterium]
MIDIHCHILPEVDDGPKSWETAETMCKMAAEDGIRHMVATPHANDHYFYDREYLSGLVRDLERRIGGSPTLSLGCDFHLSYENMQSALVSAARYCIGLSQYLLVEFSNFNIPPQIDDWMMRMRERGVVPIITHPERNPILQQTPERVLQWLELGCAVQVTASAVTGLWGPRARQAAQWLLRNNAVQILATDAHDPVHRPPILSAARQIVARQFGEQRAHMLVEDNPGAVLRNQAIA